MERIIMTGATGFIGANLTRKLISLGYDVHILIRTHSNLTRIQNILPNIHVHKTELEDYHKLNETIERIRPTSILHLAAYGCYPYKKGLEYQQDFDQMVQTNILDSLNLLRCAAENGVRNFISAGSSSEYGHKTKAMKETDILTPVNNYGATKAAATILMQTLAQNLGVRFALIRLFSVYGYYEESTRLFPTITISVLNNLPIKLASPYSVRDFIFIEDAVDAFIHILVNEGLTGVFNVGSGEQQLVNDVVSAFERVIGRSLTVSWNSIRNQPDEPNVWKADHTLLSRAGWAPKIELEKGISKFIGWYRNEGAKYYSSAVKAQRDGLTDE